MLHQTGVSVKNRTGRTSAYQLIHLKAIVNKWINTAFQNELQV